LANIEGADQHPRGGVPQFDGLVPARQYAAAIGRERNREHCDGVPKHRHDLYLRRILCAQGSDKRQQHHQRNEKDSRRLNNRRFPSPGMKSVPHGVTEHGRCQKSHMRCSEFQHCKEPTGLGGEQQRPDNTLVKTVDEKAPDGRN
jgi:hypothetical protein